MTVRTTVGDDDGMVRQVELIGLTPGLRLRFVPEAESPAFYLSVDDGPDGLVQATDLPALVAALSDLAVQYGYSMGAPSPA